MHDLIIRGGTVVDGTGAARRTADVAVTGDRIAAVGRDLGRARREIDADGFRKVILANPSVLERVTSVVTLRKGELDRHRDTQAAPVTSEGDRQTFLARVRRFLRI